MLSISTFGYIQGTISPGIHGRKRWLDIDTNTFKLQAKVATGCELNVRTNEIQVIPSKQWYQRKKEYINKAKEHYKICEYPAYNLWARFNPEEAEKIRPLKQ